MPIVFKRLFLVETIIKLHSAGKHSCGWKHERWKSARKLMEQIGEMFQLNFSFGMNSKHNIYQIERFIRNRLKVECDYFIVDHCFHTIVLKITKFCNFICFICGATVIDFNVMFFCELTYRETIRVQYRELFTVNITAFNKTLID